MAQYDSISRKFARIANRDPIKLYSHYPTTLKLLGTVDKKLILDIGCGSGQFDRTLASHGAEIVGYDISEQQIAIAQSFKERRDRKTKYLVSTPETFVYPEKFDKAFALLSIMHAESFEELTTFFRSAYDHLVGGGIFMAMVDNTNYKRCGLPLYRRIRTLLPDNKMGLAFLGDEGETILSITLNRYNCSDYEQAASAAGFHNPIVWQNLIVTTEGNKIMGEEFWSGYLGEDCPYRVFTITK